MVIWQQSQSDVKPIEIEPIKDGRVYVRKNIRTEDKEEAEGKTVRLFIYDEALMEPNEFSAYRNEQNEGKIYYVAMMTGVDIDV